MSEESQESIFQKSIDRSRAQKTYQKIILGLLLFLIINIIMLQTIINTNPEDNVSFRFNALSILLNGFFWGSMYLALAVGLTLTYKLLGFPNFAHAEFLVIGGFTGIYIQQQGWFGSGYGLYFGGIVAAFIFTGLVAVIADFLVFQPLRNKNSSPQTLMITSLGLSLVLRGMILLRFGNDNNSFSPQIDFNSKTFVNFRIDFTDESFFPQIDSSVAFKIVYDKVYAILIIFLLVVGIYLFLRFTRMGKAMRAVSDNSFLAASSGINVEQINRLSWFIGGGSAGVAGIFYAQLFLFRAETGSIFLLPAFAVIVLGSIGSIVGVILAAYILGFIRVISLPYLVGIGAAYDRPAYSTLTNVVPFVILIVVLLFYDKGIGQAIEDYQIEKIKKRNLIEIEKETSEVSI